MPDGDAGLTQPGDEMGDKRCILMAVREEALVGAITEAGRHAGMVDGVGGSGNVEYAGIGLGGGLIVL